MINLIAAMTKKKVIGKGNQLPWQIPNELQHFKKLTLDCTVIMGKRTFESIGRPLPKRHNIVLTPNLEKIENVDVCNSIDQALTTAQSYGKNIFVIGGAYTYEQFLPFVDRLYISFIKQDYDGDVFFPEVGWNDWKIVESKDFPEFEFFVYERLADKSINSL
jgi:dihydrofolate reductase